MEYLLKSLAHHWHLSSDQYWHLRLLSATSLGPLLGVLCLVIFGPRARRKPTTAGPKPPMRIDSTGRLIS